MTSQSLQEILCCIGYPLGGNPTQYLMEKSFALAELDWRLMTAEVKPDDLAAAVAGMRALGFRGGVISRPHNNAVVPLLDGLSDTAQITQQVTLLDRQDDRLVGDDTVGKGLLLAVQRQRDIAGLRCVLLGAGSAARSVAVELALAGASELLIANRTVERADELASLIIGNTSTSAGTLAWDEELELPERVDLLVNATSVGTGEYTANLPLETDTFDPAMLVADLTLAPPETSLLRTAATAGCPTIDGLTMIVEQALYALHRWTSIEADPIPVREWLEEFLGV